MADTLTFWMGKHPAELPTDRRYCRNHMWCRPVEDRLRFGFSTYAVRLMQDVYFLDWNVSAGESLAVKQPIGHIETSKAVSDLFAPLPGLLVAFNAELLKDPSGINVDPYGAGWLFEMHADDAAALSAQDYHDFLAAGWENTQRILKGQMAD